MAFPRKIFDRDLPSSAALATGEDRRGDFDADNFSRILNLPAPLTAGEPVRKSDLEAAESPTAHTHGNFSNVGAIGASANLPVITTTAGVLTTGAFGTTANTFCEGNDARLSDSRAPTAHTHAYTETICLSSYTSVPVKTSEFNFHGFLDKVKDAGAVSSGSPLSVAGSLSKLLIVVNAGADLAGTLRVTGTSVDRNTGAETGSDTDDLVVDAVTTDGSDTDAQGNIRHSFTGAYLTSKWFKGTVSISTTDLNLSDVDVWQVAFEQFNDEADVTVNTLDITVTNVAVGPPAEWCYGYLYALERTGSKADISRIATVELATTPNPGPYRLRKGMIAKALDGTTDGVWLDVYFGPTVVNEWENLNTKIWATIGDDTATT